VQVPRAAHADPGAVAGVNRWGAILAQFRAAQDLLQRHAPTRVLTAGGDCSVDIAPIDYLRRRHPDLTVLWVDAHLDANTPATSPSGNFHGMPVAAILGRAPASMREHLCAPLDPARFRYFGIRVGDEGDWAFQREHGLAALEQGERLSGPVHVHFDLDVLDPAEFPHVAYPEGVLSVAAAIELLERVARDADIVGLTITEFAPGSDEAAREGSRVIERLCQAVHAAT
jgi:arginase